MAGITREISKRRGTQYRVDFRDRHGKLYAIRGFDFKPAAEGLRDRVNDLEQLRDTSKTPNPELLKWVESIKPEWRAKLVKAGLVASESLADPRRPGRHLYDFWRDLEARGRNRKHVRKTARQIGRVLLGAKVRSLADLTLPKVEAYLLSLRDGDNAISADTYNHYLKAVHHFSRWLVRKERATVDPLAGAKPLEAAKVRKECTRERRAATPEEMRWLLAVTEQSKPWQDIPAADRRLCYWLASMTGLRASEIKTLVAADFQLGGESPTVTVRAKQTKNSDTEPLLLSRDLANALAGHLKNKVGSARALRLPHVTNFARMLRHDLESARRKWLDDAQDPKERDRRERLATLKYTDDIGRTLDFHALRHTRGCWLFEHHGANPKEVQTLMRLSSLALVDRYTRSFRLKDKTIADRGPDLNMALPEPVRAVGTFDVRPSQNPAAQIQAQIKSGTHRVRDGTEWHGEGNRPAWASSDETLDSIDENGVPAIENANGPGGDRTPDQVIMSHLL
jgi:integrase